MRKLGLLTVALLVAVAMPASAQVTIGAAGGGPDIFPWGKPNTQTYGQTITVGAASNLTDFSFWFGQGLSAYNLNYRAYVYQWNQATMRATGGALYASAVNNITGNTGSPNVQRTFNTGGLALSPGGMYVLFVSVSGLAGNGVSYFEGSGAVDQYAGGEFVFQNNGENTGAWTASAWSEFGNGNPATEDLRFEANFTVPEPGTFLLFATGLFGLAIVSRRRREIFEV